MVDVSRITVLRKGISVLVSLGFILGMTTLVSFLNLGYSQPDWFLLGLKSLGATVCILLVASLLGLVAVGLTRLLERVFKERD